MNTQELTKAQKEMLRVAYANELKTEIVRTEDGTHVQVMMNDKFVERWVTISAYVSSVTNRVHQYAHTGRLAMFGKRETTKLTIKRAVGQVHLFVHLAELYK